MQRPQTKQAVPSGPRPTVPPAARTNNRPPAVKRDQPRVLAALKTMHQGAEDFSLSSLQKNHSGLRRAAIRCFESLDHALRLAGIDPQKLGRRSP